jgi:hypothetical protein
MSFQERFALADDSGFQQKVTVAAVKVAAAVMAEDPTTAYHQARGTYAVKVLAAPEVEGMNLSLGVVTNAAITADSPDDAIEFTVASLWPAYSGSGLTPV